MDQDPIDQNGQNDQNPQADQNGTTIANTDTINPVNTEASSAAAPTQPQVESPSLEQTQDDQPSAPATISADNEAMLAAALNEPAAPTPMQPLMSSAKPKKTRLTRKKSAADSTDEGQSTDTGAKMAPLAKKPKTAKAAHATTKDQKPAKKSKVNLIIAIILIVIMLLSIAGVVVWYFVYYSKPEVVAFDAINHALSAENVGVNGQIFYEVDNESSSVKGITLDFTTVSNTIPNNIDATLQVDMRDDPDLTFALGMVQMEDGIIYLRIEGIMDAIDAAELDSDTKKEISTALELAEEIDGEWWEISVADVAKSLDAGRDEAKLVDEVHTCIVDAVKSDWSNELANSYQEHRFITIEKVSQVDTDGHWFTYQPSFGNSLYQISLNKREMANFLNELPEGQTTNNYVDCYNDAMKTYMKSQGYTSRYRSSYLIDTDDFDELSAYDIDIPDDMHFYFEISDFGHILNRFLVEYSSDEEYSSGRFSVNLAFDYRKVTVSAPSSYKPLTDLIDDDRVEDAMYELMTTPYSSGGSSFYTNDLRNYGL